MKKKLEHHKIREEMDKYINHMKSTGFEKDGYTGRQTYVELLRVVTAIEECNMKWAIEDEQRSK